MAEFESAAGLRHRDPSQLWFQVAEIIRDRGYLRHGVVLDPGDTVFDVGANVGVAASFFAVDCGAGLVHSFEPVSPLYELLCENVEGLPACQTHNLGLSDERGSAEITYYPGAAAMSGLSADPSRDREFVRTRLLRRGFTKAEAEAELEGRFVPVTMMCELKTLSEVIAETAVDHIDLLKIDVERAEFNVLNGVGDSDWPRVRQLAIEVHDEAGRMQTIAAMLADRGFTVVADQDEAMRDTPVRMLFATRR